MLKDFSPNDLMMTIKLIKIKVIVDYRKNGIFDERSTKGFFKS